MSTNSHIWMKNDDGTFTGIYCHFDGYLSCNGKILFECYKDKNKVKELIALGSISSLDCNVECPEGHTFDNPVKGYVLAYHRDRGEDFHQYHADNLDDLFSKYWNEYNYFFIDGKWFYTENKDKDLIELTSDTVFID